MDRRFLKRGIRLLCFLLGFGVTVLGCFGQSKTYSPKNGVLNIRAIVLGGAFRVSTAIPLHGDFSKFQRVEIVRLQSRIGNGVPSEVLNQLTQALRKEIERGARFAEVSVVDSFQKPQAAIMARGAEPIPHDFREADPLEAPMRSWDDLKAFDEQRGLAARRDEGEERTSVLAVVGEVIDYAKGNKFLQLVPIDLWNAILTVRFSYYDMETGEELGRQVVSSDNSSKVVPSILSPRNALTGIVEGMVDQVTRRKVAAEY